MPSEWQSVTTLPPLKPNELHLWQIHLSDATGDLRTFRQHLSALELERAERLRAGQVRMQFVVARGCLRFLLGNLLDLPPELVPITLSAYGKPEILSISGGNLFFSVAHSREMILIALCRSSRVGIDIEYIDRVTDILEIARNSFTSREILEIEQAVGLGGQQRAFFHCWTRKEAVIKADGRGLSLPLNSFEVPVLNPASSTPVLVMEGVESPAATSTWFVSDIALDEEVAAAFAVALPHLVPRTFRFPLELSFS